MDNLAHGTARKVKQKHCGCVAQVCIASVLNINVFVRPFVDLTSPTFQHLLRLSLQLCGIFLNAALLAGRGGEVDHLPSEFSLARHNLPPFCLFVSKM